MYVQSSPPNYIPTLVSSSNNDNEYENTHFPSHSSPVGSVKHGPIPVPTLSKWVCTIQEAYIDIFSDHKNQF